MGCVVDDKPCPQYEVMATQLNRLQAELTEERGKHKRTHQLFMEQIQNLEPLKEEAVAARTKLAALTAKCMEEEQTAAAQVLELRRARQLLQDWVGNWNAAGGLGRIDADT